MFKNETEKPVTASYSGAEYCATNKCYTPTMFALFGVGTLVMGALLGIVGLSYAKHRFVNTSLSYSFSIDILSIAGLALTRTEK